MRAATFMAGMAVLGALSGCGSSPKERFFVLSDDVAAVASVTPAAYSIGVGPVTVPEIVDRPQFVLRRSASEVAIAEQARWAEPLKSEIARVIAANIARTLADAHVSAYPQNAVDRADFRVLIDLQRFDSAPGEAVTLEALWSVRQARGGALRNGKSTVREAVSGAGYEELVAAHRRALATISREIAGAVRALR
jgi:hypothetical protein